MRKFILYASMAFILFFCAVANIEAGSGSNEIINVIIDTEDPCDQGNVDCTYVFFTSKDSPRKITMARRVTATVDDHYHDDYDVPYHAEDDTHEDDFYSSIWYEYELPIYTKSQVQAGYYMQHNAPMLIMAYSADQEGKSGAIVSRVSDDYGKTWYKSRNITDNQHKFGLAVAPNSLYAATNNDNDISFHKYNYMNTTWSKLGEMSGSGGISSDGLAVVFYDNDNGDPSDDGVSVAYVSSSTHSLEMRNCNDLTSFATNSFRFTAKRYQKEAAWMDDRSGVYYLAVLRNNDNDKAVLQTSGTSSPKTKANYSGFEEYSTENWKLTDDSHVSGMWKCKDTGIKYVLATGANGVLDGLDDDKEDTTLFINGGDDADKKMHRRVSMFNVPKSP